MPKLRLDLRYEFSKYSAKIPKLRLDLRYKFSGNPKNAKIKARITL